MVIKKKLMEKAGAVLRERGNSALELARLSVMREHVEHAPLRDALHYFIEDWNDMLHPALVSLACEAVGGKPETTLNVSAALVLLAGGADVHDDLIDGSLVKAPRQTVFGRFGKDLTILAGDALLVKGVYLLHEAFEGFERAKKAAVLEIVKQTFFEVSGAEVAEAGMRGRIDVSKQEYLDVIRRKVAAGEASTRIGAILGGGTPEEVEILAEYGRVYGVLLSIRDEFVDMFEEDELINRIEKEVLPLPIMVALKNESLRYRLLSLLDGKKTKENIEEVVDIVTESVEGKLLVSDMRHMVDQINFKLANLRYCGESLQLLTNAALEDL